MGHGPVGHGLFRPCRAISSVPGFGVTPSERIEVVAIFGPTASGKSAVALVVAERLGTEVVSVDAMQVYRGLPILTNQQDRPTRLVAFCGLDEEMSVGRFAPLAHRAIDELVAERGTAVVTGGTGLYLRAALADLDVPAAATPAVRSRIEAEYDRDPGASFAALVGLDPGAAAVVHQNDRRRVVRALELAEMGLSLAPARPQLWAESMRRPTTVFGLDVPNDLLEQRIRDRTRAMFERGVVAEVEAVRASTLSRTAMKTLGLDDIASLSPREAEERIAIRTRQYAAYQRKWMRRIPGIAMVAATGVAEVTAALILEQIGTEA